MYGNTSCLRRIIIEKIYVYFGVNLSVQVVYPTKIYSMTRSQTVPFLS